MEIWERMLQCAMKDNKGQQKTESHDINVTLSSAFFM